MSQARDKAPLIVLASASPRRRRLFELLGIPHEVAAADIDEWAIEFKTPRELALKAAFAKTMAVEKLYPEDSIIIAADTIVALEETVFGKPKDSADAVRMLSALSGKTHKVISGLAVREVGKATEIDAVETLVTIRQMREDEIEAYVKSGESMDKAGAYAIQGLGGSMVERVDGDFYNVVGLPVARMLDMLEPHTEVTSYREEFKLVNPSLLYET
jgi:septum formation protein